QAADGYNGFVLAHDKQPDLIIMDVRMPKLSGLEVARTLTESVYTKDIPLIIATPFAVDDETLSECKCDGYLRKPFILKEFIDLVESLIDQASLREGTGRSELQAAESDRVSP